MKILILVTFILFLDSCTTRRLYVMPSAHTQLISEANDFQFEVYSGNSWNFQAAWSPISHFSIYSAYEFNTSYLRIDYSYRDIALGTYFRLDSLIFEILTGIGGGKSKTTYSFPPEGIFPIPTYDLTNVEGNYTHSFFQFNIGQITGALKVGLAMRMSHVNFNKLKFTTNSNTATLKNVSKSYFEPIVFVQYGWKYFGLKSQIGYPARIGAIEKKFDAFPFHLAFGVYINLSRK